MKDEWESLGLRWFARWWRRHGLVQREVFRETESLMHAYRNTQGRLIPVRLADTFETQEEARVSVVHVLALEIGNRRHKLRHAQQAYDRVIRDAQLARRKGFTQGTALVNEGE